MNIQKQEIKSLKSDVWWYRNILSLFKDDRLVPGLVKWIKGECSNYLKM
jgi:hypothetical protein